ncbi:mannosyltransferase family protein [Lysobacter korlensis]|uniref:Mannosyltransferase family protein n=1 Tax=Lysobacter korlensis TaxID=553636 RepID=A0ABV6RZ44_9GAMM
MAERPLTHRRLSRVRARAGTLYVLTPWWGKVLAVFAVSRIVSTAVLLSFAARQPANAWTGPSPGYFDFAKLWDGHWYFIIAVSGYPSELPLTDDGHVAENAWAFMPAYPSLVRALMTLTGAPFAGVAVVVSVLFAAAAALLLYRLMNLVLPSSTALFSVVLFCFSPLSPLYQVAYAESMHTFLLTAALALLLQRRYWMLLPVLALASLTRPSGLAFALTMVLHVAYRWWTRREDPFPARERVAASVAAVFSGLTGLAWLLIAWAITGSLTAYTDTELAWRAPYIGYTHLIPFTPWVQGANWWLGEPTGAILLAIAVAAFAALMFTPWVRRLGVDLRLWVASYVLYLLAVFFPQSSTPRLLLPTFPLFGAIAQPTAPVYRVAVVLLFILGQIGWVHIAWWADGVDWTPP